MTTASAHLMIYGATGRMGQALVRLSSEFPTLALTVAVGGRSVPEINHVLGLDAASLHAAPPVQVCIDFSLPDAFDNVLEHCVTHRVALVSGTTGLSNAQLAKLDVASRQIPVIWAANYSLGVAVLSDLVRRAAQALPQWQRDIVESHHIHKKDAPSGTALALGQAVIEGGGDAPHYSSLRAGDIVGEHLVQFAGMGERIELIHRATHRDVFARGALHCAEKIATKPAGRYQLMDLIAPV